MLNADAMLCCYVYYYSAPVCCMPWCLAEWFESEPSTRTVNMLTSCPIVHLCFQFMFPSVSRA